MTSPDRPRFKPASLRLTVYCDTIEQKQALMAEAKAHGRRLSRHALLRLLNEPGEVDEWRRRWEGAERALSETREELRGARAECDAAQRALVESQEAYRGILKLLDEREKLAIEHGRISIVDGELLRLLSAQDSDGGCRSILEREIILQLDAVEDPDRVKMIQRTLAQLVEKRLVRKLEVRGKPAYEWSVTE